ncbi:MULTISPECIES: hypothetical protein [unclassified Streptomyces]|uniref:hypothetical protein n=1 Tax=unclassified Streptomyces TaxID=2593676 RepID=UPI0036DFABBC
MTNDFGLHPYSPHSDYVSRHIRTAEHLDQALATLAVMTGYFSAELPVRHFLATFPDETTKAVDAWARDEDFRVRRLASEATRPLLPWAPRIAFPFDAGLPVLEQLHDDAHPYVPTSVTAWATSPPASPTLFWTPFREGRRHRPLRPVRVVRNPLKE